MANNLANLYLNHYASQRGGGFPVFRGSEHQYGNGLGDILRAVGRFLIPIFVPAAGAAAGKFISTAASHLNQGKNLRDAARQSIAPSLNEAIGSIGSTLQEKIQRGSGKRKRKYKGKRKSSKKLTSIHHKVVYKRANRKRNGKKVVHFTNPTKKLKTNF